MVCVPFIHRKGQAVVLGRDPLLRMVAENAGLSPYRMMGLNGPVCMVTLTSGTLVTDTTCASPLLTCIHSHFSVRAEYTDRPDVRTGLASKARRR